MTPFATKNILVPVDMRHKEACEKAIETAVYFARQTGGKVSILTTANPLGKHLTDGPAQHEPAFRAFVDAQGAKHDFPIKPIFRAHESPNHVIREAVEKNNFDFVVMATHHPKLTDHLFGSHASQTALHADCSVLILRNNDQT